MQTAEKVHIPQPISRDPPDEHKEDEKKRPRIKVRVSLYYDGTQNNRANTNVRKNVERGQARGQSEAEYKANLELFMKRGMSGSSYDNDESNVSRLEGQSLDAAAGYDHYFHVYTEGIGTVDKGKDSLLGAALGAFETGIYAKVDIGIANALASLREKLPPDAIIEELALDTCGFSRGAAAARFAIHRALNDGKKGPLSMKTSLELSGFEVKKVKVLAVCLFDSVSSYGLRHSGNVKALKLDAIRHAKAVLQLAAAEEYRENFSLTNIESAGGKGRHVYLPGAHSDVGGCYEDGMVEKKVLFAGPGSEDIAKFLRDCGWYTARELEHVFVPPDSHGAMTQNYVTVNRSGLLKEYSYIPLHIMADFAKEQGLQFSPKLEKIFELRSGRQNPTEPEPIGKALVEEIKRYAKSKSDSKASDWQVPRDDLKKLRNRYLHVPYSTDIGMAVRVVKTGSFWDRTFRPYRLVYGG